MAIHVTDTAPPLPEPAEFTASDMQEQWDAARRQEREYWENHMRGLHAERDQYRARYEELLKQVADLRAFEPTPPILLSVDSERLKAAEVDAARYRWLRDYAGMFYNDVFNDILHFDSVEEDAANLDSAIDRAMGSTTSGGEPHE